MLEIVLDIKLLKNRHCLNGPGLVFPDESQYDQRHNGQRVEHPGGKADEIDEAPNIPRNQHQ